MPTVLFSFVGRRVMIMFAQGPRNHLEVENQLQHFLILWISFYLLKLTFLLCETEIIIVPKSYGYFNNEMLASSFGPKWGVSVWYT